MMADAETKTKMAHTGAGEIERRTQKESGSAIQVRIKKA